MIRRLHSALNPKRVTVFLGMLVGLVLIAAGGMGGLAPAQAKTTAGLGTEGRGYSSVVGGDSTPDANVPTGSVRAASSKAGYCAGYGEEHTETDGKGREYKYFVADTFALDGKLRLCGTGWQDQAGKTGSAIGIKLDGGGSKDGQNWRNYSIKLNGKTYAPRKKDSGGPGDLTRPSVWTAALADKKGNWKAEFAPPMGNNEQSGNHWKVGQSHEIQMLSGQITTVVPNDTQRSPVGKISITPKGTQTINCSTDQVKVTHVGGNQTAQACIQQKVSSKAGSTMSIWGAGWTTTDKSKGSNVLLKLNSRVGRRDGTDFQFQRTDADEGGVLKDPGTGKANASIWQVIKAGDDGTIGSQDKPVTVPIPQKENLPAKYQSNSSAELKEGSKLTASFDTGSVKGDTKHSVTSNPLIVDGKKYAGDLDPNTKSCTTDLKTPTVKVEYKRGDSSKYPKYGFGEKITMTGEGWCNNPKDPDSGGASIALKLDGNKNAPYSGNAPGMKKPKQTQTLTMASVWDMITVNSGDGSFSTTITLPSGKSKGKGKTDPAFDAGIHTIRLLTGSTKQNAIVQAIDTNKFCVNACVPALAPDLIDPNEDLTKKNQNGFRSFYSEGTLTGYSARLKPKDYAFISLYDQYTTASYPHGERKWLTMGGSGFLDIKYAQSQLPEGKFYVVLQDEDEKVVGWKKMSGPNTDVDEVSTEAGANAANEGPNDVQGGDNTVVEETIYQDDGAGEAAEPVESIPMPDKPVDSPIDSVEELNQDNTGGVTGKINGNLVTLKMGKDVPPGEWVYLYIYPGKTPIGWLQVDTASQIQLDVTNLPEGDYQLVLANRKGELAGWAQLPLKRGAGVAGANLSDYLGKGYSPSNLKWNDILLMAAGGVLVLGTGAVVAIAVARNRKR